jgi:hypothetical protein
MEAHSEMPERQLIMTFMEHKKQTSLSLFTAFACAIITFSVVAMAHAQSAKVDPSGTWVWANPGRNGNPGRTNTLVLKLSGDSVTGTLKSPARGNAEPVSTAISEGKLAGDKLSFNVSREVGTNTVTVGYEGAVTADAITGTVNTTSRSGEKRSRKWEAKRENAATK